MLSYFYSSQTKFFYNISKNIFQTIFYDFVFKVFIRISDCRYTFNFLSQIDFALLVLPAMTKLCTAFKNFFHFFDMLQKIRFRRSIFDFFRPFAFLNIGIYIKGETAQTVSPLFIYPSVIPRNREEYLLPEPQNPSSFGNAYTDAEHCQSHFLPHHKAAPHKAFARIVRVLKSRHYPSLKICFVAQTAPFRFFHHSFLQ